MADRAILISGSRLVVWCLRCRRITVRHCAVTLEAELSNVASRQHLRIVGSVRCVAGSAALGLDRTMFEYEGTLLVAVALDARGIGTDCKFGLLRFETTVSVVTVTAAHGAFEHLVMERFGELGSRLRVASEAELGFSLLQHRLRATGILCARISEERGRSRRIGGEHISVGAVAVGATDVVAPMFSAPEVVM